MSNPDHRGEFSKLYYQVGDYDVTQDDADILADSNWIELCVVDVNVAKSRATNATNDRCSATLVGYTGGKRDVSVSINLNELRHDVDTIRDWHEAMDGTSNIALLILNDERTETAAWGWVGNFISEQNDETQPQEGDNAESVTFKPAAKSAYLPLVKRIYGSGIA